MEKVNRKCVQYAQICDLYKGEIVTLYNIADCKIQKPVISYSHKRKGKKIQSFQGLKP